MWLIKDTPEEAGFRISTRTTPRPARCTYEFTTLDLLKKVFTSRLMLLIAVVELTSGVLRNGIMQWYSIFAHEVKQPGAEFFRHHWGLLLCIFGIVGGFTGGLISDKLFQSRRGPPAALLCGFMFVLTVVMAVYLFKSPLVVGLAALLIVDGGDRRALADVRHGGGGFRRAQSDGDLFGHRGRLRLSRQRPPVGQPRLPDDANWLWWPVFLMPFALLGGIIAWSIWHELPAATRKYIAEHEHKAPPAAGHLSS